jgi:hypothetical protein
VIAATRTAPAPVAPWRAIARFGRRAGAIAGASKAASIIAIINARIGRA